MPLGRILLAGFGEVTYEHAMRTVALLLALATTASCQVNVRPSGSSGANEPIRQEEASATASQPQPAISAAAAEASSAPATAPASASVSAPPSTSAWAPPGKVCFEKGCLGGLRIDVIGPKGGFAAGAYTIDVAADGKSAKCELSLPLPACDKGAATKCTGDLKITVNEAGCALAPKEQGFGPLSLPDSPAEVHVVIKKGSKKVSEGKLVPTYRTLQPNGPDCPPTCRLGKDTLTIQ